MVSVALNIPHCLSGRSKLQHILFKVHQRPLERADKENKLREKCKKPTSEEGVGVGPSLESKRIESIHEECLPLSSGTLPRI